jgi:hypothetical protein
LQQQFEFTETPIVYYYCDYKNGKSQRPEEILKTILASLARFNDNMLDFIGEFLKRYETFKTSCSIDVLLQAFLDCIKRVDRAFIVIDALDESTDRQEFLERLAVVANSQTNVNLFLTSRMVHDIAECFEKLPKISIDSSDVASDIELYVTNQLETLIKNRKLKIRDPTLRSEIRNKLTKFADGM